MRRVVAALRRQVERDRQAGLALRQQELVALVRFFGGAEARVLADGPQPALVAVGKDAARERIFAGRADMRLHAPRRARRSWRPRCPPRCARQAGADGSSGEGSVGSTGLHLLPLARKRSTAAQCSALAHVTCRFRRSISRRVAYGRAARHADVCALMPQSTARDAPSAASGTPQRHGVRSGFRDEIGKPPGQRALCVHHLASAHHARKRARGRPARTSPPRLPRPT